MKRKALALGLTALLVGVWAGWAVAPGPRTVVVTPPKTVEAPDGLVVRIAALRREGGTWVIAHRNAARVGPGEEIALAFPSGVTTTQPEAWPLAPLGGPRVRAPGPTHRVTASLSYTGSTYNGDLHASAKSRAERPNGKSSSSSFGPYRPGFVRLISVAGAARVGAGFATADDLLVLGIIGADDDPDHAWDVNDWRARVVDRLARHPSDEGPDRYQEWSAEGARLSAVAAALAPTEAADVLARVATLDPESVPGGYAYSNTRNVAAPAAVLCGASRDAAGLTKERMQDTVAALESALGLSPWHWHVGSPDPDARGFAAERVRASVLTPSAARDVLAQGADVPADIRQRARAVVAASAEWEGRGTPRSLALTALLLVLLPLLVMRAARLPRWFRTVAPWYVAVGVALASVSLERIDHLDEASLGCALAAIGVGATLPAARSRWRWSATGLFVVAAVLFAIEHVTGSTIVDAGANAAALGALVCTLHLSADLAPPPEAIDPRAPQRPRRVVLRDIGRLFLVGLMGPAILTPIAFGTVRGGPPPIGVIAIATGLLALVLGLLWWRRRQLEIVFRASVTSRDGREVPRRFLVVAWLLATTHVAAIVATVLATRAQEPPHRVLAGLTVFAGIAAALLAAYTATHFVLAAHDRRTHDLVQQIRADVAAREAAPPG